MNRNMDIAYLIDVNFERGGAPISTKILAEGMSQSYNVCVIKPYNKSETETKIPIVSVTDCIDCVPFMVFHPIRWLDFCRDLEEVINNLDCKILHSHMPNVGIAVGLLKMLKKIDPAIKLVYTDREHVAYLRWIHKIRYWFFIAKRYDAIITLSDISFNYWRKWTKIADVRKIYNTASLEFENTTFRKKHFSPLRVIMVGRIVSDKGWPLGIEIIKKNRKCHYTLVISFFDEDQKREAEKLIRDIIDFSNVDIYFNLSLAEVRKLYQKVDILVMTSERESFGRTAVEAMSQGCAVVGTQVGGLPEVIGKPENCLCRVAESFCNRLDFYGEHYDVLEQDKEFFYNRYIKLFSMSQNIENHCLLYHSLLERNKV